MIDWLSPLHATLDAGQPAVLVTVVHTVGSTPREAGATMLIGPTCVGSIGGGRLEWLASSAARALLQVGGPPRLLRFALGPSLGQCCGGIVWLIAERIDPQDAFAWKMRLAVEEDGFALRRHLTDDAPKSTWQLIAPQLTDPGPDSAHLQVRDAHWSFTQQLGAEDFPVIIFGAGHVGAAVVRALAPLGAQITWVDERDDLFPDAPPDGVACVSTDLPTAEVADAPPGSYFLVMTHSHTLDFDLCEEIFQRRDFAWFGLIGSVSKRNNFARQLTARGLPPLRLDDLTCPIGIAGIQSKHPAAIAAAVVAQLLQVRETRSAIQHATHPGPDAPPLSSLPRPQ